MLYGSMMVWDIQNMAPKFTDYDIEPVLPLTKRVFNKEALESDPKHLLRSEEDKDRFGNAGQWVCNPSFSQAILFNNSSKFSDDETVQMVLDSLPNQYLFKKVYIKPEK